jgi:hypothetical protein
MAAVMPSALNWPGCNIRITDPQSTDHDQWNS